MTTVMELLLVVAGVLTLAAGVGLLRFRDALSRLHAGTKPQVLGLLCVLAAVAIGNGRWELVATLLPVFGLQLVTIPVSAHMVARAAYRTGNYRDDLLTEDELAPAVEAAAQRDAERRDSPHDDTWGTPPAEVPVPIRARRRPRRDHEPPRDGGIPGPLDATGWSRGSLRSHLDQRRGRA